MALFGEKKSKEEKSIDFAKKHHLDELLDEEDLLLLNRLNYFTDGNLQGLNIDQNYLIIRQLAKLNKNMEKLIDLMEDK